MYLWAPLVSTWLVAQREEANVERTSTKRSGRWRNRRRQDPVVGSLARQFPLMLLLLRGPRQRQLLELVHHEAAEEGPSRK